MPGFAQMVLFYMASSRVLRSIPYGTRPRNRLDLYLPPHHWKQAEEGLKPVVVFVTGACHFPFVCFNVNARSSRQYDCHENAWYNCTMLTCRWRLDHWVQGLGFAFGAPFEQVWVPGRLSGLPQLPPGV